MSVVEYEDSESLSMSREDRELMLEVIHNEFYYRRQLLDKLEHPDRDIYKECGYTETDKLSPEMFLDLYLRFPIATRIVELPVNESWRQQPLVYETEDEKEETEFEKAWNDLHQDLREEKSFFQDDEGSPIWEALVRWDTLSRIGRYGVLLLEFDDVNQVDENGTVRLFSDPVKGMGEKEGKGIDSVKLIGLRCFDEAHAWVSEWDTDPDSKRCGKPKKYNIRLSEQEFTGPYTAATTTPVTDYSVHWSRVLHVTERRVSSEYVGVPACQPVANHLQDLLKVYASSGEGYWRVAFPGLVFESHPQLGGKANLDVNSTKTQMRSYHNTPRT